MSASKRAEQSGRGSVGTAAVVGVKDRTSNQARARVVENTDSETLHGFIRQHTNTEAAVYTDEASIYNGLPFDNEAVQHSVGEYVREHAHTNGIESF